MSETAGVASETGGSALLVSPLDVEGTAHAMAWALDMPAVEREARLAQLRASVNSWTAAQWLDAQLEALGIDHSTPAARKETKPRSPKKLENLAA